MPGVQVQRQLLVQTLQFSARLQAQARVDVGSTMVGRVEQVLVQEGDAIAAGQVLVQLQSDEWLAKVQQAQASVAQAQSQLAELRSNARIGHQAQVAQAQATLVQAQSDWQRHQQLVARGFLSQAALEDKQKALQVAQAQLDAAKAQAQASADGGAQWQAAHAQVQQAQAALAAAQAQLAQTRITAPRAGQVLLRDVEPGHIVQPGAALLQLALQGPVLVVAQVDERFLEQLQVGQSAQVVADAFPQQPLAAQVQSIAPSVDAQRGSVEVKLSLLQAPPAFLREDMTLSVAVQTAQVDQALAVPPDAVWRDPSSDDSAQVLLLKNGKAVAQPVQLGLRTLQAVQITHGIEAGDTVLLPPAQAGQRVRVQPTVFDTRTP